MIECKCFPQASNSSVQWIVGREASILKSVTDEMKDVLMCSGIAEHAYF